MVLRNAGVDVAIPYLIGEMVLFGVRRRGLDNLVGTPWTSSESSSFRVSDASRIGSREGSLTTLDKELSRILRISLISSPVRTL